MAELKYENNGVLCALETVGERSDVASKGKSRVSKLGSENEHKNWKELRAMNGPINCCNPNEPIEFDRFIRFSEYQQKNYIRIIEDRYHVTVGEIANMMGTSCETIRALVGKLGIDIPKSPIKTSTDKFNWREFLSRKNNGSNDPEELEGASDIPEVKSLSRKELLALSQEERLEWVRAIHKRFPNVSLTHISNTIGIHPNMFVNLVRKFMCEDEFKIPGSKSPVKYIEDKKIFDEWYLGNVVEEPEFEELKAEESGDITEVKLAENRTDENSKPDEKIEIHTSEPVGKVFDDIVDLIKNAFGGDTSEPEPERDHNLVVNGNLNFDGEWKDISSIMDNVLGEGKYRINIAFSKIEDSE